MGASPSHDLATGDGLVLRNGRLAVEVGQQFAGGEWLRVVQMRIQGVDQARAFLHNPHAGMFVSMNAAFMPLRLAKPAFQVEVVARLGGVVAAQEQPRLKTAHDLAHVPLNRIFAGPKLFPQDFELLPACGARTERWLQGCLDEPYGFDVTLDGVQAVLNLVQSPGDAPGQTPQLDFGAPPFLTWTFRSKDCCTSCNASAIRKPGGCNGPP